MPDVGFITLRDAETGELVEVDTRHRAVRDLFATRAAQRSRALGDELKRVGVDQLAIDTQRDYLVSLRRFFEMREKRFR